MISFFSDIQECSENPCKNGATCVDDVNNFKCSCAPGWEGPTCEIDIDECTKFGQPCLNGGICDDGLASYTCICQRGFTGINCEMGKFVCLFVCFVCLYE